MADDVSFEIERLGSTTVLRPSGYLDVSTSPRLREKLQEVSESKAVVVDLGTTEFLDSTALGVLLGGWKQMSAAGGTLVVVSPQERITKLFEITALNLSMKLYTSVEQATAELGRG